MLSKGRRLYELALKYSLIFFLFLKLALVRNHLPFKSKSYFTMFICIDLCFSEDESVFSVFLFLGTTNPERPVVAEHVGY